MGNKLIKGIPRPDNDLFKSSRFGPSKNDYQNFKNTLIVNILKTTDAVQLNTAIREENDTNKVVVAILDEMLQNVYDDSVYWWMIWN